MLIELGSDLDLYGAYSDGFVDSVDLLDRYDRFFDHSMQALGVEIEGEDEQEDSRRLLATVAARLGDVAASDESRRPIDAVPASSAISGESSSRSARASRTSPSPSLRHGMVSRRKRSTNGFTAARSRPKSGRAARTGSPPASSDRHTRCSPPERGRGASCGSASAGGR